jgi:iron complex transport system substrate-binding protein
MTRRPGNGRVSRRTLLAGAAVAGFGVVGACGTVRQDRPVGDGRDGFPRTVRHLHGNTDIPSVPHRVVSATDYNDLDAVLAVGIVPVAFGFSPWLVPDLAPWAEGAAGSVRIEGQVAEIDLERIAAQRPDLIVAQADLLAGKLDVLGSIAPTVTVAVRGGDWRTGTTILGRATGREPHATAAIGRAEAGLQEARAELAALRGSRVAVISRFGGQIRVDSIPGAAAGSGALLADLGMVPFDGGVDPASGALAEEDLTRLAEVDALLVQDFGAEIDELTAMPLFARLPAVRERRAARLSPAATRATYLLSSLSVPYAAREIVTCLLVCHEQRGSVGPTATAR